MPSNDSNLGTDAARPIATVASALGVWPEDLCHYGQDVAKVSLRALTRPRAVSAPPKLVLVSAMTPTPAGEGKTTTTIGIGQAFTQLGESVCLALREPSLGPCFGVKGGATGAGRAQVIPMERINLHFTGDFHAITAAHNLLAALIDNHLHFGNTLDIDPERVVWPRVLDVNDRALRHVTVGQGGAQDGVQRASSFDITAASEVMAIVCLAADLDDLRARFRRIVVAYTRDGAPVRAEQLHAHGPMTALLRDALDPNLVQARGGTPVLMHGGPFANIAHGCNSLVATRMAMHHAEWTFTEAGFGFDLGAEKFFDIKCRVGGLDPCGVVLVATVRALGMHGGASRAQAGAASPAVVRAGLPNLDKHLDSAACFGRPVVVALNRFDTDTDAQVDVVRAHCAARGVPFAVSDHVARGAEGALALAEVVRSTFRAGAVPPPALRLLYELPQSLPDKVRQVARAMYGARDVTFTPEAERDLEDLNRLGFAHLPVCIAKTQSSLTDDPKRRGRPRDFDVTVRGLRVNAGAGFVVVMTGDIVRMPGLPRAPRAEQIDVVDGVITGLR